MAKKKTKLPATLSRREKRLLFYELIKQGYKIGAAEEKAGLYKGAARRISQLVKETGDVNDRPRSGRPRTYDAELLDKATDVFMQHDGVLCTETEFTALLQQRQILHRPYKVAAFIRRWRQHLKSQGHTLRTRYTGTVFLICKEDQPKRVAFATELLQLLKERGINSFVFVDETTLEQSPHPKSGRPCLRTHASMLHANANMP